MSAGYLAFNGAGVGDTATAGLAAIVFDGSSVMNEEDGRSGLGIMQEEGTQPSPVTGLFWIVRFKFLLKMVF